MTSSAAQLKSDHRELKKQLSKVRVLVVLVLVVGVPGEKQYCSGFSC